MKFDRLILMTLNGLARLFGVLAILAGIVFLVSAYAVKANRFLDIAIGFFLMAMGIRPTSEAVMGRKVRRGTCPRNQKTETGNGGGAGVR
jgi:uncharacterized membrane protein HdeD (DUF308 family)